MKVNQHIPLFTAAIISAVLALSVIPLAIFKLFDVVEWSWLWILSPLLAAFLLFEATCVSIAFHKAKRRRDRQMANGTYRPHPKVVSLRDRIMQYREDWKRRFGK